MPWLAEQLCSRCESTCVLCRHNQVDGQRNLRDAVRRTITYTDPKSGKAYQLKSKVGPCLQHCIDMRCKPIFHRPLHATYTFTNTKPLRLLH